MTALYIEPPPQPTCTVVINWSSVGESDQLEFNWSSVGDQWRSMELKWGSMEINGVQMESKLPVEMGSNMCSPHT